MQSGASLDWQAAQQMKMYSNLWYSSVTGYGYDSQATWTHAKGSVALSHGRSWYTPDRYSAPGTGARAFTSLSASYRISGAHSVGSRLTHRSSDSGIGIDAGYSTYLTIGDTAVNLRADVFDRPYRMTGGGSTRDHGVALSISFSPGTAGRSISISASIGSRLDARGRHDWYASATLSQAREDGFIRQSSFTVRGDRQGLGVSSYNHLKRRSPAAASWASAPAQADR